MKKRGRPKLDFTPTEEAILMHIAENGPTHYKALFTEHRIATRRAVRNAENALLREKHLLKMIDTDERFIIKPLDLTFSGVLYILTKLSDEEILSMKIVSIYKDHIYFQDLDLLLKSDMSLGLWWIQSLRRVSSYLKLWNMDEDQIKANLLVGMMKEAYTAPEKVKENAQIGFFANAYPLLADLLDSAIKPVSSEEEVFIIAGKSLTPIFELVSNFFKSKKNKS